MTYETWTSLPDMFFDTAKKNSEKPFLWSKIDGIYQSLAWKDIAAQVEQLANGLQIAGIQAGDRVVLVSENRPEWVIADLAIMSTGAITVPAYTTNQIKDHQHILNDSGAKAVFVSTQQLASQLIPAAEKCGNLEFIISIENLNNNDSTKSIYSWNQILDLGKKDSQNIEKLISNHNRDDVACIIYTSGTGGQPKGVMLSHHSIISNCKGARSILEELGVHDEIFLSFLPLSHAYEHTAGLYFPVSISAEIYFSEGIEKLATNLIEVKPTLMISVPRLYEVMYAKILQAVRKEGGIKEYLFSSAVKIGSLNYENPNNLNLPNKVTNQLLNLLVRKKIKARFGGRLKAMISGGAPLNFEVGIFFTALGVRLLQGYGQTEAAPVISCNRPNSIDLNTVGSALDGVKIKIADDGEILVSGPLVMKGYWNDADSTSLTIREGWLHTGDVGHLDSQNRIKITDRKKDIIVLSGGDNVSPQRVEGVLTLQPVIAQAMVVGDKKPHLVALLVPDQDFVNQWKKSKNVVIKELDKNNEFLKIISDAVEDANNQLSRIERIKGFIITFDEFSVQNELMTPTLKVRRHKVSEIYQESLNSLY